MRWSAAWQDNAIEARLHEGSLTIALSSRTISLTGSAPLRLRTTEGDDLLQGLRHIDATERAIEESYDLAVGKRVGRHEVRQREHRLGFERADGGRLTVVLRAAHDGVAFRLILDGLTGTTVKGSDLQLTLPEQSNLWPLTYTPWYEEPRFSSSAADLAEGAYGLPLLAQLTPEDDGFVLIAESDIDGHYGGAYLAHESGRFSFTLADPVQIDTESVAVPWRVFHLGTLAEIVTSHLVDDLARPAAAGIPSWVRPGRGAWSWWSDFYSGAQLTAQLRLVDYAADHGWEHVLVDCGWDRSWIPELVAAASARGIGIVVWVSWDWLDIESDLEQWASWGISGIKVDFMESESQVRYQWYDRVIAEAARVGLMVNFHGSVIPRGWARTHPHVLTYEAVRGAEYYVFYGDPLPPAHNTIVPFTRNVIGSADYTPVTFSTPARLTSEGHELALAVVLESGMTHFADDVSEYARRPLAERVLDAVRATWDETRLLGGRPGDWVALARRHGDHWFVGVISAGPPREVEVDLDGLFSNGLQVITDGEDGLTELTPPATTSVLRLELAENGGAVVMSAGAGPSRPAPRRQAPVPERTLVVADPGDVVEIAATELDDSAVVIAPPGWPEPTVAGAGRWNLTVPQGLGAGHVGVVSIVNGTGARAHVRVTTHPAVGTTDLVPLVPIAASNGFGPFERNTSNGPGNPNDGGPLTVAGTRYERGLGVCSPAALSYALGGRVSEFSTLVGLDDETPEQIATARVLADGVELASLTLRSGEIAQAVTVAVAGRTRLELIVDDPSGSAPDARPHVDWINPQLTR